MKLAAAEHPIDGWAAAIEAYFERGWTDGLPVGRPEYMPVLRAALDGMADPAFTLHGAITSTGGSATLVVVNGPIRHALNLNAGANVFGPGWRANATIGRSIRLVTLNCLGASPGVLDKSTQIRRRPGGRA